ncbi:hypothetical protein GCM10018785_28410 [Streptomyces longispororuber]|uniref:Uncharacterized protein n=1 Tax=Streptomyces longispororuber TaxID=68230 RepID=A0A918ZKF1_9ACTN|nr:hypothetical protein GCM10018785_28410 [Streptomyces longispororuber]
MEVVEGQELHVDRALAAVVAHGRHPVLSLRLSLLLARGGGQRGGERADGGEARRDGEDTGGSAPGPAWLGGG